MSQYLPYIQNTSPEPVMYTPDFNFFNSMLQKKELQYEQGVKQAAAVHNSVTNAALSNVNNVSIRDQYVKQAQLELKKISGSDLSLPQNQAAAQSIYSPFWEDSFILKDQAYTKSYQAQQAKLTAWRDSPDAKTRAMYSPVVEQYLNNGQRVLQNATRTPEDFSKVERREAVPFTNIQEYLQEMAKKNADGEGGLKIVYDDVSKDGAYLISTTNGRRSTKAFATWAEGMIANNFDEQFKITGIVTQENLNRHISSLPENQGAPPEVIKQKEAEYIINDLKTGYERRIGNIRGQMSEIETKLKIFPKTITDPEMEKTAKQLIADYEELSVFKSTVEDEYAGFDKNDKNIIRQKVLENPNAYFQTLAKQQVVKDWSVARSEIGGVKIGKNEAYFAKVDDQLKVSNYALEIRKQELAEKKQREEMEYRNRALATKGKKVTTNADGSISVEDDGTVTATGIDERTGGKYLGVTGTDVTEISTKPYDIFMNHQANLVESGDAKLFNPTTGVISVLESVGLAAMDVTRLSSALKKGDDIDKWTPEQKQSLKFLTEQAGFKSYKAGSAKELKESLFSYAKDYFSKKNEAGVPFTENEKQIFFNYIDADHDIKEFNRNEERRSELLKTEINANPEKYEGITVKRSDGTLDVITKKDLEKNIPTVANYGVSFEERPLTKKKIAELYYSGRIKTESYEDRSVIEGNSIIQENRGTGMSSNYFTDVIVDGKRITTPNNAVGEAVMALERAYGSSDKFAKKISSATTSIVPDLGFYQSRTGKQGGTWQFDITDAKKNLEQIGLFQEALAPGNQFGMYDISGGKQKELDPKVQDQFTALLNNPDAMKEFMGSYQYNSSGINGNPTIIFSGKSMSEKSKETIPSGDKLFNLFKEHSKIAIELDPTKGAEMIHKLPSDSGNYLYQKLLQGQEVKSDDFLKSFGFEYSITPNNDGAYGGEPTGGISNIKYPVRVNTIDANGNMVSKVETKDLRIPFNLVGEGGKTPDGIMDEIHQYFMATMQANENALKEYEAVTKAKSNSSAPAFDLSAQMKKLNIK